MTDLTKEICEPCKIGSPPLTAEEIVLFIPQLSNDWKVIENRHLERQFRFADFKTALAFVVQVGAIAEAEGHHPDIYLGWGKVKITLSTHKIKGLSKNDFILATKIDKIRVI